MLFYRVTLSGMGANLLRANTEKSIIFATYYFKHTGVAFVHRPAFSEL